MKYCGTSINRK